MQQYADIYSLQSHSTCFGCPPHPSSAVLKTVTSTSGTGHNTGTAVSIQRGLVETGLCEHKPVTYSNAPYNDVSVNDGLHVRLYRL